MVGGRKLQINQEPNSLNLAPNLVRDVWAVARQLDARSFKLRVGREVLDDHLALNNAGIPAIDLIDFDYPYWHKADDLPKNCSAESLAEVGRVVTAWLAQPERRRPVVISPGRKYSSGPVQPLPRSASRSRRVTSRSNSSIARSRRNCSRASRASNIVRPRNRACSSASSTSGSRSALTPGG